MACEFATDWDVKRLHKLIVTSATYRQSSHVTKELLAHDRENRLVARFPRLRLALSLHSARQEQRERIIPLARRYPLDRLRWAMAAVTAFQQQPLMVEYLLLEGLNDTDADVQALIDYLLHLPVQINLIPYNPIDEPAGLRGTGPARRREFAAALQAAGFVVRSRYSLGADIAAGCGQLVRSEQGSLH